MVKKKYIHTYRSPIMDSGYWKLIDLDAPKLNFYLICGCGRGLALNGAGQRPQPWVAFGSRVLPD